MGWGTGERPKGRMRDKKRDMFLNVYPLQGGTDIGKILAYQKKIHHYGCKNYSLSFYGIMILSVINCINKEGTTLKGATMTDLIHYMRFTYDSGRYWIERLKNEGYLHDYSEQGKALGTLRPNAKRELHISLKAELALKDIEHYISALLSALPPKGGEKAVKKRNPVDKEKKKAKELAKWEGLGGA